MSKDQASESIETISAASDQQQQQQVQIQIDDAATPCTYSTTARVWGSAEEINLDFAGPIKPGSNNTARLKIEQRVILNPWAAKRLALALAQAVQRYERAYGVLELDARKRLVRPSGGKGGSTPS